MVDNFAAAYRATHYLVELGHQRVGIATAAATIASTTARLAGYRQALADGGVAQSDWWIRIAGYSEAVAQAEIAALLARPEAERPTAILGTDSILTAGAFRAIQACGLVIPADISLIGFDDVDWMSMVRPMVTVVNQPEYELGKRAAERLMARIEGDESPAQQVRLETELIVRRSCARPSINHAMSACRLVDPRDGMENIVARIN